MIVDLIFFLLCLLLAFVLLYPFYLKDHKPAHYKGIWRAIGIVFRNRYGVIWLTNFYLALNVSHVAGYFTNNKLMKIMIMLLYFLLFTPVFLWYPFHLKYKRPEKYKGTWRRIGEWLGNPRDAFQGRGK